MNWGVFVLIALAAPGAWAGDLPRARPEELGFSSERLDFIDRFYADQVQQGEVAGIVILIARHGRIAHLSTVGYVDVEKQQKMQSDTIFRLYSMTKPIASTALMMLYQEGRFQMSDPVANYIPEFANLRVLRTPNAALSDTVPLERAPTVQDLLRHTAGFSHGGEENAVDAEYLKANVFGADVSLAEMMSRLSKIPLREQPGKKFIYSVGPDIQARLVEVLSGMPFDEFLQQRLFKPLGMKDAGFWVPAEKAQRLATVYWIKDGRLAPLDETLGHPEGGFLVQPQSVNGYAVNPKHKGGSYGLVGTAEDYWRFAQMLLNGGQLDGARLLGPQVIRYMARDHLGTADRGILDSLIPGLGFGLGFAVIEDPPAAGLMSSEGTYFWGGAAETHFWVDPKEDMAVVAMTQRMGAPLADAQTFAIQIRTLVYSALIE